MTLYRKSEVTDLSKAELQALKILVSEIDRKLKERTS